MNTRMERYNRENLENSDDGLSRVNRNSSLYQDIKNSELKVRSDDNIRVIESNGKTIDIEKIKRYIEENNNDIKKTRKSVTISESSDSEEPKEQVKPKDYDLNSVLEKAKQSREVDYENERYKKLRDTQYDILSKIKMYEEAKENDTIPSKEDFNTEERTLIDLINTVTIHKGDLNLLDELVGNGEEETTLPIKEEVEKKSFTNKEENEEAPVIKKIEEEDLIKEKSLENKDKELMEKTQELVSLKEKMNIDNSFYTSSMSFDKKDFEGFEELEKSVKKNSIMSSVIIVLLVVFIVVTLVIIANYVFKLGLF